MTTNQATAIIVLLAIPTGVMLLVFTCIMLNEHVCERIRQWRQKRQYQKEKRIRQCESDFRNLQCVVSGLRRDVQRLNEAVPPKQPTKPVRSRR